MKNFYGQFLALFLTLSLMTCPGAFAQTAVVSGGSGVGGSRGGAMPSHETGRIGVVAAVRGKVESSSKDQVGRLVESGQSIYMNDVIKTDSESTLQLLLLDETVFTIGPSSSMTIREFLYDPNTDEGKVEAEALDGTFRFITGKIARKKPSHMQIKLPTGVMAVRGTMAYLKVEGEKSTGILAGPGSQHNTSHRTGSIAMINDSTDEGGKSSETHVTQPGFASTIEGAGAAPSAAFQFPESELQQLRESLDTGSDSSEEDSTSQDAASDPSQNDQEDQEKDSDSQDPQMPTDETSPEGDSEDGSGGTSSEPLLSGTEAAGQDTAGAFDSLMDTHTINDLGENFDHEISQEATDSGDTSIANSTIEGIAYFRDLTNIQTGKFNYSQSSVPMSQGNYDFYLDIDFGARTVGGGNSKVVGSSDTFGVGTEGFKFLLGTQNFGAQDHPAVFAFSNVSNSETSSPCSTCVGDIVVYINNDSSSVASSATHAVTVTDGSSNVDAGAGEASISTGAV